MLTGVREWVVSPMNVDQNAHIDEAAVDAITSLANHQRLQILLALNEAEREHGQQWYPLSFTDLHDAVDIESSSQFSYHLEQLVSQFVSETPAGYRLTYSGNKIVRAIVSGVYESTPTFEDSEVDGVCAFCGAGSLLATLESEQFVIQCSSCESTLVNDFLPRSQTRNRTSSEIAESVGYRIWSTFLQVRGGVCPECFGCVETTVDSHSHPDGDAIHPIHVHSCRACWLVVSLPVEVTVAFHPVAQCLFWEHDISLLDVPLWEFFGFMTSGVITTDVVSEEPFAATFELTLGDETVGFSMDETAIVTVHVERDEWDTFW